MPHQLAGNIRSALSASCREQVSFTGVGSRGKAPALLPQHQQEEPPADQQKPLLEMAVNNGRKLSKLSEIAVNKGRKLSEEITVKSAAVAESCWESFQRDVGEAADTSCASAALDRSIFESPRAAPALRLLTQGGAGRVSPPQTT